MVFLPRATPGIEGLPYQAPPQGMRPISLSDTFQKVISKAVTATLEHVSAQVVHSSQTGFIRGRRMGDNVLRSLVAMGAAVILGEEWPSVTSST